MSTVVSYRPQRSLTQGQKSSVVRQHNNGRLLHEIAHRNGLLSADVAAFLKTRVGYPGPIVEGASPYTATMRDARTEATPPRATGFTITGQPNKQPTLARVGFLEREVVL